MPPRRAAGAAARGLVIASCLLGRACLAAVEPAPAVAGGGSPAAPVARPPALQTGEPAPDFSLSDPTGTPVTLAGLRGKVVYLHFWATWCAPCKESFAWLKDLQGREATDGLVVLGVNVDAHRADADTWLAAHPTGFAVVFDTDFQLARGYDIRSMPEAVLIDAQGRVQWVQENYRPADRAAVEARLRPLLRAGSRR